MSRQKDKKTKVQKDFDQNEFNEIIQSGRQGAPTIMMTMIDDDTKMMMMMMIGDDDDYDDYDDDAFSSGRD